MDTSEEFVNIRFSTSQSCRCWSWHFITPMPTITLIIGWNTLFEFKLCCYCAGNMYSPLLFWLEELYRGERKISCSDFVSPDPFIRAASQWFAKKSKFEINEFRLNVNQDTDKIELIGGYEVKPI